MPIDAELLEILACPACKTPVRLVKDGTALKCDACHRVYAIKDDIPVMLLDEATVEPLKILLVRLRLVGDVVFTTPAIRALRRRYPAAVLDYVVEPAAAPVVRHNPHLNTVIEADRPRGLARLRCDLALARRLRAARYDVAIDFHGGPRSAFLVRASGAPVRIGYDIPGRRWAYTTRVAWHPHLEPPRHSVLNQWDLLGPLDVGPADPDRDAVEMVAGADAVAAAERRLAAAGVTGEHALVVLHVSASNPFRRWPRQSFAEVAAALAAADPARRIMITAGPSEADAADAVAADAARLAGEAARGDRALRRAHPGGTRGHRGAGATLHRRGFRSAARRGDDGRAQSWRSSGPRCRRVRCRGARRRRRRWRWSRARCRAGPATSAPASPATSAA